MSAPTLRDQFAMAALTGMLADSDYNAPADVAARQAYQFADAMLRARGPTAEAAPVVGAIRVDGSRFGCTHDIDSETQCSKPAPWLPENHDTTHWTGAAWCDEHVPRMAGS